MQTVDFHTHLLSPRVRFDRPFDRIALRFFAASLGTTAERLRRDPYNAYLEALTGSLASSRHVAKACLFPVDARVDERGREVHRDATVCSSNEEVSAVCRDHPDRLIPFLSVNPLRPDAVERIDAAVEAEARGAKLLQNYWGTDLNDARFTAYFERLRDVGVPLVIHVGSEYSIDSYGPCERLEMVRRPLEIGCTVVAAHMGLGRVGHPFAPWRNLSRDPVHFDRDYHQLLEWLEREPNLYADLAAILAPLRARALRHLSEQHQIHHKLLFASDYPVPFTSVWNSFDLPWAERRRIARIDNPFDRYTEILLRYFPESSPLYTNHAKLLG